MEFYATYDVMTGVRIAATLGGFFGLMVFLIVYKSRSHSNDTLKVLKVIASTTIALYLPTLFILVLIIPIVSVLWHPHPDEIICANFIEMFA